jgi:centriolar protein POC1
MSSSLISPGKKAKFDYYENPELVRTFRGSTKTIKAVAMNPTGKSMAAAGDDGEVRVWQFKSEMRPFKYNIHTGPVNCLNFNDDGGYLASGGNDGKIFVTKHNAKCEGIQFKAHAAPIKSAVFSKDGNRLLTAGDDKCAKLWTINYKRGHDNIRKAVGHEFVKSFTGHTDWIVDANFSPDNRLIATVCNKSVHLWDIISGSEIVKFKNLNLQNTSLSFHPDGNFLAVSTASKHIKIWDMRFQKLAQDYLLPTEVNCVRFHPYGTIMASANNYYPGVNCSSLSLFDIRQTRSVFEIEGINDSLLSVSFGADGTYFAAGGKNKLGYVWKSHLNIPEPAVAREEVQAKASHETDIGGAISLEKQFEAYADRDKNEVYQQISTGIENIVLKINNLSE